MEKMKQLGVRAAAQAMAQGKSCADTLLELADDAGVHTMPDGQRQAFFMGLMAVLCGNMAASISAKDADLVLSVCRGGMFAAEAQYRKKEAH